MKRKPAQVLNRFLICKRKLVSAMLTLKLAHMKIVSIVLNEMLFAMQKETF